MEILTEKDYFKLIVLVFRHSANSAECLFLKVKNAIWIFILRYLNSFSNVFFPTDLMNYSNFLAMCRSNSVSFEYLIFVKEIKRIESYS